MARVSDEQILEAGVHAFGDLGFHATSMAAVAERARVTKPTLYARIGGKDKLLESCLEHERKLLLDHLFSAYAAAAGRSLRVQIEVGVQAIFNYARERPHGYRLIFGDWSSRDVVATRRAVVNSIEARVAGLIDDWSRSPEAPKDLHLGVEGKALLASLIVGTSLQGAAHAATRPEHLAATSQITASFVLAALRQLDPRLLVALNKARPTRL